MSIVPITVEACARPQSARRVLDARMLKGVAFTKTGMCAPHATY